VLDHCVTEAGLHAAVSLVQREEYAIERLSPDFNAKIIEVIKQADAELVEEEEEEEADQPMTTAKLVNLPTTSAVEEEKEADQRMKTGKLVSLTTTSETTSAVEEDILERDKHVSSLPTPPKQTVSTPLKATKPPTYKSDTPRRGEIRVQVAAAQKKQAESVNKKRIRSGYVVDLEIGSVCRIKVEGNTRAATDHPTIPVIVTSCRNSKLQLNSYTIASRDGHLAGWYARENLEYEPIWNAKMIEIDINQDGFKKDLTIPQASALYNQGGGATTCKCQTTNCATNSRCKCMFASNYCTSKCHGGRGNNMLCTNCPPAAGHPRTSSGPPSPPGVKVPHPTSISKEVRRHISTHDDDKKPSAKRIRRKKSADQNEEEQQFISVRGGIEGECEKFSSSSSDEEEEIETTIEAGDDIKYWNYNAVGDRFHECDTIVSAVLINHSKAYFPIVVDDGAYINRKQSVKVKGITAPVRRFTLIPSGQQTSSVKKASERVTAIVKKNVERVFGEGSSLEKDLIQLPTTTTAEKTEEKEMSCAVAESQREDLNSVSMARLIRGGKLVAMLKSKELTHVQQINVDNAIYGTGDHEVLATSDDGADSVKRKSMETLRPEVWLNDEIVNYYLKNCLRRRDERFCRENTSRKRSHFFNTFFVQQLFNEKNGNANLKGKYTYNNVKRWHKHAHGKNVFNLDYVFFPVNKSNVHWTLVVVFMEEKRIQYYDSYEGEGKGRKYLNGILQYLKDEHKRQFKSDMDESEWRLVTCSTIDTPQQLNGCDCGVFVCLFADFIAMDCAPVFDQSCIDKCRDWIALSILGNCAIDYLSV